MKTDKILLNGMAYVDGDFSKVNIGISDGKISFVTPVGQPVPECANVIDLEGKHILPGLIDTHVHLREPGFTDKEDISTGTMAAAAGGVTFVVDMPNTRPSTNSYERLLTHIDLASSKAFVDFNHWVGPPADNKEITKILDKGAIGIKLFMMNDTKRSYPHMPELGILNDGHLYDIMCACKEANSVLAVHPHNQELFEWIEQKYYWANNQFKPQDYAHALRHGDSIVYDTAFATLLILARSSGVHLHLLHLNTYLGTKMVKYAVDNGVNVTAEMNAPHFFITWKDVEKRGPYVLGTWTPPKDQEALWKTINEMPFTTVIGTDHAPHTIAEKEIGWTDMWKSPGGAPYIQDYLSLFLDAYNKGRVSLKRIVEITSEIPAKTFGLYPRKGAIKVGADADFAVVDLNAKKTISAETSYSKAGYNPFEGWEVKGIPVMTILGGKVIVKDNKIIGNPGDGKFVPCNH